MEFVPGDSVCGPGIVIPGTCVQPSYDHSKDALILGTYRTEIEKAGFVEATGMADTSAVFVVGVTPTWGVSGSSAAWRCAGAPECARRSIA